MFIVPNLSLPFQPRILYFDEKAHKYTDDRGCEYTSTTTLIHQFVTPFNSKQEARRLAQQNSGFYKGMSAKRIERMWKDVTAKSCDNGTVKHGRLEDGTNEANGFKEVVEYVKSKFESAVSYLRVKNADNRLYTLDDILSYQYKYKFDLNLFKERIGSKYPDIYRCIEWYVQRGYEVYAEVGIYDPRFLISGMIDLLVINRHTKRFAIIDWKTNKDEIKFKAGYYKRDDKGQNTDKWVDQRKFLKYPLDNLFDCNGIIYSMQLSIYAYMVSLRGYEYDASILFHIRDRYKPNKYGMPFKNHDGMYIVDETQPEYVNYHMLKYLKDEVIRLFDYHAKHNIKHENFKLNF